MSLPRPSRKQQSSSTTSSERSDPKALRPTDVFRFEPQPDITVTELAELVAAFFEIDMHFDRFLKFREPLRRHFRQIKTG